MPEETRYDKPVFKILARNDTGQTGGHQGGLVIPKSLVKYFPDLKVEGGPLRKKK
jgi:hypothetical protein